MVWKPRVTVASVIEQNGRFLMVEEEHHGQIVINQPAGHLEYGESLIDAAQRETLEETGWRFQPDALLGVFHMQRPDEDRVYLRFTFSGYVLEHINDFKLDPDILRTHWLTEAEIRDTVRFTVRSDLVLRSIDTYKAGIRYPLDMLHYFQTDNS